MTVQLSNQQQKSLLAKLRRPVHVSYISKYILKMTTEETMSVLEGLEKDNIIEQYPGTEGYYVIPSNK